MQTSLFFNCGIILAAMLASLGLTAWIRRLLLRHAILDRPNARSSHKTPVPRGGGWALLAVLIPGLILTGLTQDSLSRHAGLIAGTLLLAFISWLDDRRHVGAGLRLALHIAAAALGTLALPPHDMVFGGHLPLWLDRAITILGWAWFINLYNFMDGIDGITGAETVAVSTGVCLVMSAAGFAAPFVDVLTLLLAGASLGFLAFNWHPARIFLGDVGSVPLGYLTGFALIALAAQGSFAPALILPLYYLADSGITLARRALRGERIWQAHREHFYQRAAQAMKRHDRVVYAVIAANLLLIAAALAAVEDPVAGLALAAAIVAALLTWMAKAGRPG